MVLDLFRLMTILTLLMAMRSGAWMFMARDVSVAEQWARLLVTAAVFIWLVVR
jgi:hypothetical protein